MSHLLAYEELDHGIVCVDADLHRPGLACCYLLRAGNEYAFIDTGTAHTGLRLLVLLEELGIGREEVRYVMPTHAHLDHAGGAGVLMAALPDATLIAHPRAARHLIDPSQLVAGATEVYGAEELQRVFGSPVPVPETRAMQADDGFELGFNGRVLRFLDTPGHARHHYSIWDETSSGIFAGDCFGIAYPALETPRGPFLFPTTTPVQFDPDAWLATIDRFMTFDPQRIYLTHFGHVEDVEALADELREGVKEYAETAHRLAEVPDRHEVLKAALTDLALRDLKQMQCHLPESQQRELLAMDMELNAQGLGVWLDRKSRNELR